jgi:GMP synthase (glutamine-hydrolysing)
VTYAMMCRWTIRAQERAVEEPGCHPRHAHLEGWHMHDGAVAHWLKAFLGHWLSGGGASVAPQSVRMSAQ